DLAKELTDAQGANKPAVVCSGVRVLYEGAHVPGAVYHGPAVKPEGLEDLRKWAQGIPRSSNVVVYCGCCPFDHCPNIRPAFEALRAMGFQQLRVLVLPNDFAKDWVEQGYRYERGKDKAWAVKMTFRESLGSETRSDPVMGNRRKPPAGR